MLIALMDSKTTLAYVKVFQLLKQYLPQTTIVKSMTDYEQAIMNAVTKVFPECVLKGCYFHFNKAVSNYAEKEGLYKLANENNTIRCGINYAARLALLPAELIPAGVNVVEKKLTNQPACRQFIKYLRKQYVNKPEV